MIIKPVYLIRFIGIAFIVCILGCFSLAKPNVAEPERPEVFSVESSQNIGGCYITIIVHKTTKERLMLSTRYNGTLSVVKLDKE